MIEKSQVSKHLTNHEFHLGDDGNWRLSLKPQNHYLFYGFLSLPVLLLTTFLLLPPHDPLQVISNVLMLVLIFMLTSFSFYCPDLILNREGFAFLSSDRFIPYEGITDIQVKSILFKHTVLIKTSKKSHVAAAFFSRKDANNFEKILEEVIKNGGPE